MSFKIAFIGAGSIGFTRKLVQDILTVPEFQDIHISLMDINSSNLKMVEQLIQKDLDSNGKSGVTLSTTVNRQDALENARYILNVVRIGGLEAFKHDVEIPLKYGIDQCVGDTIAAGGIMYGQRVIPFILDLCGDIKKYCEPDALLLNYSNPNAMVTWAAEASGVRVLGLCHGVQNGHIQLAEALGLKPEELEYSCVGINHMTWYTRLKHQDHHFSSREIIKAMENHETFSRQEKVRIDVLKRFGYYSTESNGHLSEYLPWYRKRRDEIKKWISDDEWIHGRTAGYLNHCTERRNWFEEDFPKWLAEVSPEYSEENRSVEHGSRIIEALETGRIYRGHFNVRNKGAVSNLPEDAIVELPCYVDRSGIEVPRYGALPDGPAALCLSNISVQRLSVKAALEGDLFTLKQAMLLDPLSTAVCTPEELDRMTEEMLVAGEPWLPQYAHSIQRIKETMP